MGRSAAGDCPYRGIVGKTMLPTPRHGRCSTDGNFVGVQPLRGLMRTGRHLLVYHPTSSYTTRRVKYQPLQYLDTFSWRLRPYATLREGNDFVVASRSRCHPGRITYRKNAWCVWYGKMTTGINTVLDREASPQRLQQ